MKKICILGSTGSIGKQALEVVEEHRDRFEIVGLAAMTSIDELESQIIKYQPKIVAVFNKEKGEILKSRLVSNTKIVMGMEGLLDLASHKDADLILNSVVGSIGLLPTVAALEAGKDVALANKETLVAGGDLVMGICKERDVNIIPIDSEHSAIFQCLQGEKKEDINKIILTASGGPFRKWDYDKIAAASFKEALKHPNWNMGQKISIDSASLMNKGLEVIEAKWLFDIEAENIEVVVHPQSIIHSMVEFRDNSIIAQLGEPDMKLPIQYGLSYPNRIKGNVTKLDFIKHNNLTFEKPDIRRFPCLDLAYQAIKIGGTMPCVLNIANEILVGYYLQGRIKFYDISKNIEKIMYKHEAFEYNNVEELIKTEKWVKDQLTHELD